MNRIESPYTNLCVCDQLIFKRMPRSFNMKEKSLQQMIAGATGAVHAKECIKKPY